MERGLVVELVVVRLLLEVLLLQVGLVVLLLQERQGFHFLLLLRVEHASVVRCQGQLQFVGIQLWDQVGLVQGLVP